MIRKVRGEITQTPNHLQDHVETIAKHEQEFQSSRSKGERIGDRVAAFAGSFPFVAIHVALFLAWVVINTLSVGGIRHLDPIPFPLLDTRVALEAILLASFILIRQSGLAKRADEREHLMLQILSGEHDSALLGWLPTWQVGQKRHPFGFLGDRSDHRALKPQIQNDSYGRRIASLFRIR